MKLKLKHDVNHSSEHMDENPRAELFDGFQTVRAVEKDRYFTGLATPEFATYVEYMMKYGTRTEHELKLATKKLERLLSSDQNACTLQEPTKVNNDRITLYELFQQTNMEENKSHIGRNKEKKTVNCLMRRLPSIRRSKTDCSVRSNDSASGYKKHHKIFQMFHLEALASCQIMRKYVKISNIVADAGYRNRHKMPPEDMVIFPCRSISANQTKTKVFKPTKAGTNQKRERWIKSDAEYLILEL